MVKDDESQKKKKMIFQRKIRSSKEIEPNNYEKKGLAGAKPGGGVIPTHKDTHGFLEP